MLSKTSKKKNFETFGKNMHELITITPLLRLNRTDTGGQKYAIVISAPVT